MGTVTIEQSRVEGQRRRGENKKERERERERERESERGSACLFVFGFLTSSSTELGDHDLCLSRSHFTDTDPTSRGIESATSAPRVARSTD